MSAPEYFEDINRSQVDASDADAASARFQDEVNDARAQRVADPPGGGAGGGDGKADKLDPWNGKTPDAAINPDGVVQSGGPNCYFSAAMASVAGTPQGKESIAKMITARDDGTFAVKFPGARDEVSVSTEDIARHKLKNPSNWANIIEAAYFNEHFSKPRESSNSISKSLELLTNDENAPSQVEFRDKSQRYAVGNVTLDDMDRQLRWAKEHDAPVVADSSNESAPLEKNHIYSVLDYDSQSRTVTVRNPWGKHAGELKEDGATIGGIKNVGGGKATMSLDEFYQRFDSAVISGQYPLTNAVQNNWHNGIKGLANLRDAVVNTARLDFVGARGDLSAFGSNYKSALRNQLLGVTSAIENLW